MTLLGSLTRKEVSRKLAGTGLRITVGPYTYAISSPLPTIAEGLCSLYPDFPLANPDGFADFHIGMAPPSLLHRLRGRVEFSLDFHAPFNRILARQAYAAFEWGMNWCISTYANDYLKLHAAVVARNGVAVIMPGLPGSGKSTLCAALALQGWQVLSDEHALITFDSIEIAPVYRPISLKNESIEVIRRRAPDSVLGPGSEGTHKGLVVHLKADLNPNSHSSALVKPGVMLFPRFQSGAAIDLQARSRAEGFMATAEHSFNYSELSSRGFEALSKLMDEVNCYDLSFGDLDEAIAVITELHGAALP